MKNKALKVAIVAAVAVVPAFGNNLMAREHGENTAVQIVRTVCNFLRPAPVAVVTPAVAAVTPAVAVPVVVPPPPPVVIHRHHHQPAPKPHRAEKHHPAKKHAPDKKIAKGHRGR